LRKSDLGIFEKPDEMKILTDGTVAGFGFCLAGVQRAVALCGGNAKGGSVFAGVKGQSPYRVKGETPCPVI